MKPAAASASSVSPDREQFFARYLPFTSPSRLTLSPTFFLPSVVAAAVVGVKQYSLVFPVAVHTFRGENLVVDGTFDGRNFDSVTLTGPVKTVYKATYFMV